MTTIDATIEPPDFDDAATLAATAASSVPGVHALGSLLGRASDAVRERVGLASTAPGVKIDTDRADSVTATVSLVVDYPHKLHEVSGAVRSAVRTALEPLGRGRVDVDVIVLAGVHFMAETAKLLNPAKTVLIPDPKAGCSLADSITADDRGLIC